MNRRKVFHVGDRCPNYENCEGYLHESIKQNETPFKLKQKPSVGNLDCNYCKVTIRKDK